jgi:hypothetical protein
MTYLPRLPEKLTSNDHLCLREALRNANTHADAPYSVLYFGDKVMQFEGDTGFALNARPTMHKSVPVSDTLQTASHATKSVVLAAVRVAMGGPRSAVAVVGGEAGEVHVVEAAVEAARRLEKILADVADR